MCQTALFEGREGRGGVDITHQHSTHRSTQCTHLHSSLQRQSVFVFASRFLDHSVARTAYYLAQEKESLHKEAARRSEEAVDRDAHEGLRGDGPLGSVATSFTQWVAETVRCPPVDFFRSGATVVLNDGNATEETHVVSKFTPESLVISSVLLHTHVAGEVVVQLPRECGPSVVEDGRG